ncbi:hypothetical protein ACHAWF_005106, partial [Thalassiosira exigua]
DDAGASLVQRSLDAIFLTVSERSLTSPTSASAAAASGGTVRTTTKASHLEIYNKRVYDLLAPPVHDNVGNRFGGGCDGRVNVEGLTEREVRTADEALDVLRAGMDGQRVAATNMNRISSRSHTMFSLTIKSELSSSDGIDKVRPSKFTLVDLAGSDRQKSTAADSERLKKASMINASLLCLGQPRCGGGPLGSERSSGAEGACPRGRRRPPDQAGNVAQAKAGPGGDVGEVQGATHRGAGPRRASREGGRPGGRG